jgi:acyl phosphate:glycerol-3-phosphate acyltransferase
MTLALFALAGYLVGSVPVGYWVVRATKGVDIRTLGSGNVGASNVWRTYGWRYGLAVAVLDVAKGFVPALVGTLVDGSLAGVLAGSGAMLGHWRPLFLRFAKGGKMVATAGGVCLGVAPLVGLAGAVIWIGVFLLTRYASVASMVAAASLPAVAFGLGYPWPVIAWAAAAAAGVIVLHWANIRRLLSGTENRAALRGGRRPSARVEPSSGPSP